MIISAPMQRRSKGFTLMEIMIVIAILGILLMVVLPSYSDSMRKSRRADGIRDLVEIGSRQERFYAQNSRYTTTTISRNNTIYFNFLSCKAYNIAYFITICSQN